MKFNELGRLKVKLVNPGSPLEARRGDVQSRTTPVVATSSSLTFVHEAADIRIILPPASAQGPPQTTYHTVSPLTRHSNKAPSKQRFLLPHHTR